MIERMKFLNITGPKDDIDRVIETYISKYDIQLENALYELKNVKELHPFTDVNPYKDIFARSQELKEYFKDTIGKTFFEQFHAETTYSDFVYGIKPKTEEKKLLYEEHYGILIDAIEYAKNYNKPTLLIIDEINRANLSSVLGPVFYLFEKNTSERTAPLKIGTKEITKLPDNLYVIAHNEYC